MSDAHALATVFAAANDPQDLTGFIGWIADVIAALGRQWKSVGNYSDSLNRAVLIAFGIAIAKFVWDRRERISNGDA